MAQSLRTENENFTDGGLGCKERNGLERQNGDELDAEEISRYVCSEETHLVLFKDFSNFAHLAIVATLGFYSLNCILEIAHKL